MDNTPELDGMMSTLLSAVDTLTKQLPTAGAATGDPETDDLLNKLTSTMKQNIATLRNMIAKVPRGDPMVPVTNFKTFKNYNGSNNLPTAEQLMNGNYE